MTVRKKGSRLSTSTKRAVKASGFGAKRKAKLRAELRSPGVSAREKSLVKSMAMGKNSNLITAQQKRSKKRAASKKRFPSKRGVKY